MFPYLSNKFAIDHNRYLVVIVLIPYTGGVPFIHHARLLFRDVNFFFGLSTSENAVVSITETLDYKTGLCNGETSHVLCETLTEYTPILQIYFGSIFPSQCHSTNAIWQSYMPNRH